MEPLFTWVPDFWHPTPAMPPGPGIRRLLGWIRFASGDLWDHNIVDRVERVWRDTVLAEEWVI